MARSRGRSTRAAKKPARQPKAKSKKPAAPAAEVEVVEEAKGETVDGGIVIITSVVLLAAILFVDKLLARYGEGVFF